MHSSSGWRRERADGLTVIDVMACLDGCLAQLLET